MGAQRSRDGSESPRRAPLRVALLASSATIALLLGGCAGPGSAPVAVALSETPGYPADAPVPDPLSTGGDPAPLGWLSNDRATITIITYGSSSCPFIGTAIETIDAGLVLITFAQARAEACTDDLGSRTHVFSTPAEIGGDNTGADAASDDIDARGLKAELAIAATALGDAEPVLTTVTLWPPPTATSIALETQRGVPDGVILPDGALNNGDPLAFWGATRETLRVITWGSSSCPPPALSLKPVAASELALVFGALPPQACTADFAPTTHVLAVPPGVDPGPVTLTITIEQRDAASLQYSVPIAD